MKEFILKSVVVTLCIIFIAKYSIISSIEIKHHHDFSGNYNKYLSFEHNHKMDFGGNLHKPIEIKLSDPGYPVKFDVNHKGLK